MSPVIKLPDFHKAAVEGTRAAVDWLKEAMQILVGTQCPVAGPKRASSPIRPRTHSAEKQPPFLESGDGQASIATDETETGAKLGVVSMGIPNMIGGNYMAGWDSEHGIRNIHHPWLSLWKQYLPEMDIIIRRYISSTTGAK